MPYDILSTIESPDDVKALSDEQAVALCAEIREKLIDVVSVNGGHLSSNLGVVELTVALHRVFSCPDDSIVFDVGHQAYAHKMLTGRYDRIDTIRREGGLSGFPKRAESPCDAFNAGHASTSISAAYGIAKAKALRGDTSSTVAVIGDGSLTGGMAYEGLNNAGRSNKNFIVILNDNRMSISQNVGAMARYLTSIRMEPWYRRFKARAERVLDHVPLIGRPIAGLLRRSKTRFKHLVYRRTLFDKLGFSYYGPVDGHNLVELTKALRTVRDAKEPVFLHVVTKKGKGYSFAEDDAATFHGVGSFNVETGESLSAKATFSDCFGAALCREAEQDGRICAVTAAMRTGTGLVEFSRQYRDRFFDVGIAEEHAVTFCAGMAVSGMLPVFTVYSTFLQRGYDQLIHDAAMQGVHMVLGVDRAGIVGEDGETHQGVFDVAMMNAIPGVSIYSPCFFKGLERCLHTALYDHSDVVAVRYPRGCEAAMPEGYAGESVNYDILGDREAAVLIVTYGRLFTEADKAARMLAQDGIKTCILKLCRIKPIDTEAIRFAQGFRTIVFFEEGMLSGSVAERLRYALDDLGWRGDYTAAAIDEQYITHAPVQSSLKRLGLDAASMAQKIREAIA
jgi:1-deoxy-D-xylulose-5-phosphate synthase